MFAFRPIVPRAYNVAAMRDRVRALLDEEGQIDKRLMQTTVENWNEPPGFETTVTLGRDGVADTHPTGANAKKWYYLQFGTSVRYAALSQPPDKWESKTKVGTLRSGPGAGRVLKTGYKAGAHRGIDPRGWIQIIVKMRRKPFADKAQRVLGNVQATVRGYNTYKGP